MKTINIPTRGDISLDDLYQEAANHRVIRPNIVIQTLITQIKLLGSDKIILEAELKEKNKMISQIRDILIL